MHVLALSGSLRAASINSAFCRAAARLARSPLQVSVFPGLGRLPLFNPDLETSAPGAVQELRDAVSRADALVIASPEYAHGISGVMKNALDWLVSHEGTVGKPVVLVNTSPRAWHACDALREVLQTMSMQVVADACVALPLPGSCVAEDDMLSTPPVRLAIEDSLAALTAFLSGQGAAGAHFPLALK